MAGCCQYGEEHSISGATELVVVGSKGQETTLATIFKLIFSFIPL
jgi:hypothetical protein